jgi:hypothetical protein
MDFTQRAADAASTEIAKRLVPLLDTAIAVKAKVEYEAGRGSGEGAMTLKRIGAGYIGTECGRELAFRFHRYPVEEREGGVTPGELQRHALAGHWTEAMTADWLRMVGLMLTTEEMPGKQVGWMAARDPKTGQFRMAGQVDGVILGVYPDSGLKEFDALLKPPCIWESKKATDKKFKKFEKDGIKKADPVYYGQLQSNMAYLRITQTLFTMLNLDTMKFYFELVPFDQERAQYLSDRAVMVIETASPFAMPRLGRSEDDLVCKFCDYKNQCWHEGNVPVPMEKRQPFNPNLMDEVPF